MQISLGFSLAFVLAATSVMSADWPRWRGPNANGHLPAGQALPERLVDPVKEVWDREVGFGVGSPVVAGGRVFHLDALDGQEVLRAADAATGAELWKQPLDATFRDSQSDAGPRSTPLVDGDRVYAVSCRGEFQCRRVSDGELVWKVNYARDFQAVFIGERGSAAGASRHGNTASPLVDGDRLLVSVGGTNGASVVCFQKRTGEVLWKSQDDVPGHDGPVLATIAGERQLVSFTAAGVMGLSAADGRLLWRQPIPSSIGRHVIPPLVVGDLVLVSSHQAGLMAFRIVRAQEGLRVEEAWVRKDLAINFAAPVVVGGFLYGVGPARNLICVEAATGRLAWSEDGYFTSAPGNAYGGFLATPERLMFLTDGGRLVLLHVDPTACREIGQAQVAGMNWCNPAYADGRLYLRDSKRLRCLQLVP